MKNAFTYKECARWFTCLFVLKAATLMLVPVPPAFCQTRTVPHPPTLADQGTRLAVLVSINAYSPDATIRTGSLRGPKNDMDGLAAVLVRRYGFQERQILRLHGAEADRAGIERGLKALVARAGPNRHLVFGFAGHGSTRPDGDLVEEPNGRDETICPYDRKDITDDTLYASFSQVLERGAFLTVIMDSCFSAGTFKPGSDITLRQAPPVIQHGPSSMRSEEGMYRADALNHYDRLVFLAAAGVEEAAGEKEFGDADGLPAGSQGIFSRVLLRALYAAPSGWSWRDLQMEMERDIKAANLFQRPHFSGGGLSRSPFGFRQVHKEPHYRVRACSEDGYTIKVDAGSMSGLHEGDLLAVFKQGATDLSGKEGLYGYWKISRVTPVEATAVWTGEPSSVLDVRVGAAAVLHARHPEFARLRVFVRDLPDTFRTNLQAMVEEQDWLKMAGPGEKRSQHDFFITAKTRDQLFLEGPIAPWPHHMNADDVYTALKKRLATSARWVHLLQLKNQEPKGFLASEQLAVTLTRGSLKRNGSKYELIPLPRLDRDPETGNLRLQQGDGIRLSYRSLADRDLFVTVFYLARNGRVMPWNRNHFADRLSPGREVVLEDYVHVTAPFGAEVVKVFVNTLEPFNPSIFQQTKWTVPLRGREPAGHWGTIEIPIQTFAKTER